MTATTIKGYHPLHLIFPSSLQNFSDVDESDSEEIPSEKSNDDKVHSYIYFKPHQMAHTVAHDGESDDKKQDQISHDHDKVLFVANVPFLPDIQSSLLLEYIFGKFGEVHHVLIVPAPRRTRNHDTADEMESSLDSITRGGFDSYQDLQAEYYHPGKFAHVHFQSSKERKRALQHVTRLPQGILRLDSNRNILELKELSMASFQNYQKYIDKIHTEDDRMVVHPDKVGIHALVQWHQRSIPCRTRLQKKCEEIIMTYEDKEHALLESQQREKQGVPDEDGFVTVSYKSMASSIMAEPSSYNSNSDAMMLDTPYRPTKNKLKRRSTSSRGASKSERKVVRGSDPLPDFYKFQTRESRKRCADEIKAKFQQDLERVKKLKEDKEYRPF